MTHAIDRLKTTLGAHPLAAILVLGAVALYSAYAAALVGVMALVIAAWPAVERARAPEARAESAVDVMRRQTLRVVQSVSSVMADEMLLGRAIEREQFQARLWASRAEKAMLARNEEEAATCIARRHEHDAAVERLRPELEKQRATVKGLTPQLDAMQSETRAAAHAGEMLALRARRADAKRTVVLSASGLETKAGEQAFRRLADDVARAEAEADALERLVGEPHAADAHGAAWEQRERAEAVARELEALRERMGVKQAARGGATRTATP